LLGKNGQKKEQETEKKRRTGEKYKKNEKIETIFQFF